MKFEDVENARRLYIEKRNKVKKPAIGIAAIVTAIALIIVVASNIGNFQSIFANFGTFSLALIMPIGMAILLAAMIPAIVVAVIISLTAREELSQYRKAYKGYFVEQELKKTFTDIKYNHEAGLDKNILKSTGLIHTGDVYSSNDLTIGRYKNVSFMQADVLIEDEREDKDGDKQYTTIFCGRYMVFEFPKKFECRMILSPDTNYVWESNPKTGKMMQYIETESVEFNRTFLVYTDDGMEALYILTPDFMERAQQLAESHNGDVSLYFVDNKMIVGINDNDDVFEPPSPSTPLDEKSEVEKVTNEINLVTNIVDNLKLARKV